MNELRLTPMAARDLAEIRDYISTKLGNPIAAEGTVRRILNALRILRDHGEAGPGLEAKTGLKTDLRMLACGNYIAIYRVEGNRVSVARILNARQDYMRILLQET